MTEKPSAPTSAGGEGETGACDIGTLPTPSRTGCKESEQEKGQQRCASSSGNAVVVVDDDVTAPVPAEFPISRRAPAGASKLISVYSLSGQVLGEVAVTAEETVGALKEKLCDATGSDQYMDLASQMAILKDSDSIAETGLLESSHVQALFPSVTRFFNSTSDRQFGVYLASSGSTQIFSVQTRVVNRREDEEHVQTTFWGSWRLGPDKNLEIKVSEMERKVYNDSVPYGWTQQTGKTKADFTIRLSWHRKVLKTLSLGPLGQGLVPGDSCILAALLHFPEELTLSDGSQASVFDDWYATGSSTEP